jgi:hypothetical protein
LEGSSGSEDREVVLAHLSPRSPRIAHQLAIRTPPSKTGFARSKAKAMDPEIARNQNYDDHYANDSEDVHLLYSRSMMIALPS